MIYSDAYGEYLLRRIKMFDCYFELLNPDIINIAGRDGIKLNACRYLLDMTGYSLDDAKNIIDAYLRGKKCEGGSAGHLLRGVK